MNSDTISHFTTEQLELKLPEVLDAPKSSGTLDLIVIRPKENEREVLDFGMLDHNRGLIGDNWETKPSSRTPDGSPHPDKQINIMNARAAQMIAGTKDRWSLAGDQLYVDFDISDANLPAGSQIQIGEAVLEITSLPHTGCKKFTQRFGIDAVKFVNSEIGRANNLRGVNAKVVQGGKISTGDVVKKIK